MFTLKNAIQNFQKNICFDSVRGKWYFFHLSCFSKTFTGDLSFPPQFLIYVSVFFFKVFILLSIIPFLLVPFTDFILLTFDCSQCSGFSSSSVIFFGHCKCLKKSSAVQTLLVPEMCIGQELDRAFAFS